MTFWVLASLHLVLQTVFSLLIAAALLRAWMNGVRINMGAQPGRFIMALSDWLVKPLRLILPRRLVQARVDTASILAAALLALAYALLWVLLLGLLGAVRESMPGLGQGLLFTLFAIGTNILVRVALQTTIVLVLAYAIFSWVQPSSPAYYLLAKLTNPLLAPLRRLIPTIGGVDLSALVLLVLLQICLMALA